MRQLFILLATGLTLSSIALGEPNSNDLTQAKLKAATDKANMLLNEIRQLKGNSTIQNPLVHPMTASDGPSCNPNPTCVADCTSRFPDGSCGSYGADYCGPEANCALDCNSRFPDGSCGSYGPDYCGRNANCTPDCTSRFPDGSCGSYGPDVCY